MSFNPLGAFTSAASAASYVAGAAYDGLLGAATTPSTSSTAHAGDDEAPKGDATASLVAERAQVMAFHLSEMLIFARTDLDTALAPATHVVRGIKEVGHRASQVLWRLRSSTLEFLSLEGPSDAAEVMGLSRQLWSHWRAKHVALTSAERLYLALLADSRRLNALLAELSAVQGLADSAAPEEAGPPAGRAEALQKCQAQIQTQAKDAIDAFKERAKDYPCGWPHPKTDLLRIARTPEDLQSICEGFEASVLEQEKELLAQVEELLVADPRTLTSSLSRRVAFWEGQIEENWSQWSNQSSRFHEAQAGAVECWEQLRGKAYIMLAQQEASPQSREAQTEAVHKVFVEVACGLALLGAWASFHHLRGDGRILPELRDLLHSIITCLDIHFSGYQGRRAIEELLWENQSWRLVQAQPDIGRSESWPE